MSTRAAGQMTVRPAGPHDVAAVVDIEAASFSDPWTAAAFHASLDMPHMRFLVAEQGGVPEDEGSRGDSTGAPVLAGYVLAMLLGPEGEIANLAVAPSLRGEGTGAVLLDAAILTVRAARVERLYLEVRESNVAARALYHSRGFTLAGRRRGYYRRPVEDALILVREVVHT
jgi:ribosomal-protein-alanine N-acetyltransferase